MSPKKAEASPAAPAAPSITLSNLRPAKGATKDALRVGRGRASGAGKTCNRGHNGEGQRSGRSSKVGFEGGQMPAYRRLPKLRSFYMHKRREWLELNIGELDALVPPEETELSYVLLAELFLLTPKHSGVRLLGNGEIKRKLTIHVDYASPAAQEKLKAAGCTLILPEEAAE